MTSFPTVTLAALTVRMQDGAPLAPDLDGLMAHMAKVSNPAGQEEAWTYARLIRYAIKHRHWSVFEQADVTMEVVTTRDIGRQMLRHSFRPQEFSQRYAETGVLPEAPLRPARMQDPKNRQASLVCEDGGVARDWIGMQQDVVSEATNAYRDALDYGIAREVARAVLPEGLTTTRMYLKGSVRTWLHYCALRAGHGTQPEHAEIALKCWDVLRSVAPVTCEAFEVLVSRERKAADLLDAWLAEGNKLEVGLIG